MLTIETKPYVFVHTSVLTLELFDVKIIILFLKTQKI